MQRLNVSPRPQSAEKLESIGLSFHAWDDYWKEDTAYQFSAAQIDTIESATEDLHSMCLDAVSHVLRTDSLDRLGIPFSAHEVIHQSWKLQEPSLYGRFDLAYDGASAPKMLEYNADTPTSLLESAVAQWYWLQDTRPQADQFNSLHEKLVSRWQAMNISGPLHVASLKDNEEDWVCTHYLIETAIQAGLSAQHLHIEDVGWNETERCFVDLQNCKIATLFKLYPWEWMLREDFGLHLPRSTTKFIEPAWKAVLSCKGILPVLWELFEGHPNLLPAFFEPGKLQSFAKKPLFSREGANVQLHRDGAVISDAPGPYGAEGHIYQQLVQMPCIDGKYPVIGSWIVGNEAAGMCIREDSSPVTTNMSNFVPHFFLE